jgi:adenylosuccinate lyase
MNTYTAISPIDGRYYAKTQELSLIFSEFGLMRARVLVEVEWLKAMAANPQIIELKPFSKTAKKFLNEIVSNFSEQDAAKIKELEATTNHDVKAVEYFLRAKIKPQKELQAASEFIHFACTSEDINNLAYSLMLRDSGQQILNPIMFNIIAKFSELARTYAAEPILARTHGQAASPTTVGKEFANFAVRLKRQYELILITPIMGKFNGAVGNYNAHTIAYPEINWPVVMQEFVESLGLTWNAYTTQIEPHDAMAELFDGFARFNTILLDFSRDIWGYIALGYFKQQLKPNEVGSSVMPHKINPIDFENAEGNLGIANALLQHFAAKLPVSRWQRDLSDSTVLRNLGVAFAHSLLAYKSVLAGLPKITIDSKQLGSELANNWQILAEPIQTVMRRYGVSDSYEQLKQFTRGKKITKKTLHSFIDKLAIPATAKKRLKQLTPMNYIGAAVQLAKVKLIDNGY